MKKKLILIAMCSALVFGVTACTGDEPGDIVSDAGQMASQIMEGTGDLMSEAAEGVGDMMDGDYDTGSGSLSDMVSNADDHSLVGEDADAYAAQERLDGDNVSDDDDDGAGQSLSTLQSGNEAYRSGTTNMDVSASLRNNLASNGQNPHAIVISCSDSRVPPELVFNSSLGDLFVIRTAGNVVGDYEIGSVEYAAEHLGAPLVLVMGHSSCGAVGAAVDGEADGNIASIVKEISPSVTKAKESASDEDTIKDKAEDLNVKNTIANLRKSEILSKLEKEGKLTIKGAKYDIETGEVTVFDD